MITKKGEVFLLTKPPSSQRSELCLSLIARIGKRGNTARLYLAGDGVYHLLGENIPACKVYACKEDLEARGIKAEGTGTQRIQAEGIHTEGIKAEGIKTKGIRNERARAGAELTVPEAFYETFIEDLMEHCEKAYTF